MMQMRYYFNFRSGDRYYTDGEGDEFVDLAAAYESGRVSARELMGLDRGTPDPTYVGAVFEICDGRGTVLAITNFEESLLEPQPSPALKS
jgi:hypothetical protein